MELLARFTPNTSSTAGTAAVDWSRLEERMNFIIHLFRSRQKNLELFTAPLQDDELAAIQPAA